MRRIGQIAVGVLALAHVVASAAPAEAAPEKLKVTQLSRGSVEDEGLAKEAPRSGVISDRKRFAGLWQSWKAGGKVPAVDFRKEIILVVTTRGGRLLPLNATLSEEGDLKFFAGATRDLRPGFRYIIASVPRAGVKTINGKKWGDSGPNP